MFNDQIVDEAGLDMKGFRFSVHDFEFETAGIDIFWIDCSALQHAT
jgi:hypothetical protein